MKIAMLGWEFPPFMAGGLGIHCLELTTGLSRMGAAIDFYMPHMASLEKGLRVAEHHDHLRILEVEAEPDVSPYGDQRSARRRYEANFNAAVTLYNQRLVDAFQSHDADVLHCHDWITVPAALEIRRRTGIPLVFSVHSTEFDRSGGFAPQTWIEDIERSGVHGADQVICVSRYTQTLVERFYGVPATKCNPVHNGVDLAKFEDGLKREHHTARRVLFLSRMSRQKGPLFFLEAARRVLQVRPDTRFVMAGKGEMLSECIAFALRHGMADKVEFTGFVPNEDLSRFYANHDIYVLPSVSEPFGISVLEAMASGLPTIVSRSSGVGEAVAHVLKTEYWDTDEMADMVLRLLDSFELRHELGRNGAHEARRFTWDACCRRTQAVYEKAIAQAPPRVRPGPRAAAKPHLTDGPSEVPHHAPRPASAFAENAPKPNAPIVIA